MFLHTHEINKSVSCLTGNCPWVYVWWDNVHLHSSNICMKRPLSLLVVHAFVLVTLPIIVFLGGGRGRRIMSHRKTKLSGTNYQHCSRVCVYYCLVAATCAPVQLGYLDHVIYLHWHAGMNVAWDRYLKTTIKRWSSYFSMWLVNGARLGPRGEVWKPEGRHSRRSEEDVVFPTIPLWRGGPQKKTGQQLLLWCFPQVHNYT